MSGFHQEGFRPAHGHIVLIMQELVYYFGYFVGEKGMYPSGMPFFMASCTKLSGDLWTPMVMSSVSVMPWLALATYPR